MEFFFTTKKGRLNQPTSFDYSTGYALNRVSTLPEKLSIRDWVDVMLKIGQEKWWAGQDFKAYDEILKYYDQNPDSIPSTGYTIRNGIKYPIRPSNVLAEYFEGGNEYYHNVSASGGSDKTYFRSSVRYVNENGSVIGNNDLYKRWTADNSLNSQITSNQNFSAKVQYNSFNRREPSDGFGYPFYAMMSQPSFTPSGYDMAVTKDGQEKLLPYGTQNHLVVLQNPKEIKGDQLRLTGTLKFEPIKNLVFTGEYNFDKDTEQFKSTQLADLHIGYLKQQAIAQNKSIALETNFLFNDEIRDFQYFQDNGYRINLYFIALKNLEESRERVEVRRSEGGHYVDDYTRELNFIIGKENSIKHSNKFDEVLVISNAIQYQDQLLYSIDKEIIFKNENAPIWANNLIKEFEVAIKNDISNSYGYKR